MSKKVYVVTEGSYSDYHIVTICDTEAAAKLFIKNYCDVCTDIEEWELNTIKGKKKHSVRYDSNYNYPYWYIKKEVSENIGVYKRRFGGGTCYDVVVEVPISYSEERMLKVAHDTLMQAVAEGTVWDDTK